MGELILVFAPKLMKFLSVAGTLAMFLVGGGILAHGIAPIHHAIEHLSQAFGLLASLTNNVLNGLLGFVIGCMIVAIMIFFKSFKKIK